MKTRVSLLTLSILAVGSLIGNAATIDFGSFTSGTNTPINDNPEGWTFTVTMNGDGTITVTESSSAVGIAGVDSGDVITVSGGTTSTASGSFTITFDGTEADGVTDTAVQLRDGTGLGVVGRNAGRIDYNAVNGDAASEVLDILVDLSGLTGTATAFVATEAGLANWQNSAEGIITDFNSVDAAILTGTDPLLLGDLTIL